jgi:hypothetical protein
MASERDMIVEVVVKVKVSDRRPRHRHAEVRFEKEAVDAVANCLKKDKTIEFQEAELLGFKHGKWIRNLGQPVACGLPHPVRLHSDGSWSYPFDGEPEHSGGDFASLVKYVQHASRKVSEKKLNHRGTETQRS